MFLSLSCRTAEKQKKMKHNIDDLMIRKPNNH